ncbi:MAG: ribosome maturation factor RimP [Pseudomonadota bacterium]
MTALNDQNATTERQDIEPVADNDALLDEPRVIIERGAEARVATLITPELRALGYRVVRVRMTGQNGVTLQIMAERPDGQMTVGDCEAVSRAIAPLLDVEDPVAGSYHLEVSSPGIDRPLVRHSDFVRAEGHLMKVEMDIGIDGRRRFRGPLLAVADNGVTIEFEGSDGVLEADLEFSDMLDARLVLTDALIDESLGRASASAKTDPMDDTSGGDVTGANDNRRRGRQSARKAGPKGSVRKGRARR